MQNYRKGTTRRENKHNFLGLSPHPSENVWITNGILLCTYFINCMSKALLRVRIGRVHFELVYRIYVRPLRDPSSSMLACAAHTSILIVLSYVNTFDNCFSTILGHSCVCVCVSTCFFFFVFVTRLFAFLRYFSLLCFFLHLHIFPSASLTLTSFTFSLTSSRYAYVL